MSNKLTLIPGLRAIAEVAQAKIDIANEMSKGELDDYTLGYIRALHQIIEYYEKVSLEVTKSSIN